jgi:PTH1 family peptidyl-tRNA hydrolase
MAHPSHLIVGLGNPGAEYALTRHNIGFMAVDALAENTDASAWQRKFKGQISVGTLGKHAFLLLKPMTFMNLSGESVGEAMRYYKLNPSDVIVFHDDIDLLSGKVKVKQGGGNAGHNGLKSIDAHIGPDYWRVRLGIGHPGDRDQVHDHVLSPFAKADREWLVALLRTLSEHFPLMLEGKDKAYVAEVMKVMAPQTESNSLK